MFCKYCGNSLPDGAHFCATCGKKQDNIIEGEKVEEVDKYVDNDILMYELKPKFMYSYKFFGNFFAAFSLLMAISMCCLQGFVFYKPDIIIVALIIILAVSLAIAFIKTFIDKDQYKKTKYNFYNNKLEYVDGFFNRCEKELKYTSIREITMHQSVFERMFNLGTIHVYTTASTGHVGTASHTDMSGNGINIHCVENVYEQYTKIKNIINKFADND